MKINENIEITNEDNMKLMARYPDNHFDIAFVDPEYGIKMSGWKEESKGEGSLKKGFTNGGKKLYPEKSWDNERPKPEYFAELQRVSKNQIIFGGNYFADLLPASRGWIYWDKKGNDKSNFSDGELAWTSFDKVLKKYVYDWIGFGYLNNKSKEKKRHPTHKPSALYYRILKDYVKPDFKILDTNFGSGSQGIAIIKLNRNENLNLSLTACELDKEYYQNSIEWLKLETANLSLF